MNQDENFAQERKTTNGCVIELQKSINVFAAIVILLGNIGGSSVFIAPTTILTLTGSPGLATVLWLGGGLLTFSIALSVCELALRLPRAGGPYIYTLEVFGNIPGFMILWGFVLLISFPTWALGAYTASLYMLAVIYQTCSPPDFLVKMVAFWILLTLVALNCTYTSVVTKLQTFFTTAKISAMVTIIISALTTVMSDSSQENLSSFMNHYSADVSHFALALFASYFCYGGWQIITVLMEEVCCPKRVVPLALAISFAVTVPIFVLTNIAYYTVLPTHQAIASDAVAMFLGATFMLASGTVSSLINYISLYVAIMLLVLLLALIVLRHSQRPREQLENSFTVPYFVVISQALVTCVLIVISVYEKPRQLGGCLLLLALAIPVYLVFVVGSREFPIIRSFSKTFDCLTDTIQRLLLLEFPTSLQQRM